MGALAMQTSKADDLDAIRRTAMALAAGDPLWRRGRVLLQTANAAALLQDGVVCRVWSGEVLIVHPPWLVVVYTTALLYTRVMEKSVILQKVPPEEILARQYRGHTHLPHSGSGESSHVSSLLIAKRPRTCRPLLSCVVLS